MAWFCQFIRCLVFGSDESVEVSGDEERSQEDVSTKQDYCERGASVDNLSPAVHLPLMDLIRHSPCGLHNVGNSCYMNSAVQCLSQTPGFLEHLSKQAGERVTKLPLTKGFMGLLKEMSNCKSSSITPEIFKGIVGESCHTFSGQGQHDSHEFLLTLMDSIHEELNSPLECSGDTEQQDQISDAKLAEECWKEYQSRDYSVITTTFAMQTKLSWICKCGNEEKSFQQSLELSIAIPEVEEIAKTGATCDEIVAKRRKLLKSVPLRDCLSYHFQPREIEADNMMCLTCKKPQTLLTCKKDIWKPPNVLIIHLQRFFQKSDGYIAKLNDEVEIPLRLKLDYCSWEEEGIDYNLYGTINHHGTMDSGHYVAFIHHHHRWYCCNDSNVIEVDPEKISKDSGGTAYILFYTRERTGR